MIRNHAAAAGVKMWRGTMNGASNLCGNTNVPKTMMQLIHIDRHLEMDRGAAMHCNGWLGASAWPEISLASKLRGACQKCVCL